MLDPAQLFELQPDPPELGRPLLLHALEGFVDAGSAVQLAAAHLLDTLEHEVLATFDVDQLYDYRSRRPVMTFDQDHWEDYEGPRLLVHRVLDAAGTPFLLMTGPEPDMQWERFVAATRRLVQQLGVRLTVGLNAIPMAVPHTRPVGITAHGSRPELIAGYSPWLQTVKVPGSAAHLLEHRLAQLGHDSAGFAVHVPHYLAQAELPAAAEALVDAVARISGLSLPTQALTAAGEVTRADIDAQVAQSEEVAAVVRALEQQHDAFLAGRDRSLLAEGATPLPTADELGAELERFLAEHDGPASGPADTAG